MAEESASCARVTGSVSNDESPPSAEPQEPTTVREEARMSVTVGQKAPDFTAPAYLNGSFTSVKLSDYLGKWVLICFYPGDFTFV